jgi:hypothetical protein
VDTDCGQHDGWRRSLDRIFSTPVRKKTHDSLIEQAASHARRGTPAHAAGALLLNRHMQTLLNGGAIYRTYASAPASHAGGPFRCSMFALV